MIHAAFETPAEAFRSCYLRDVAMGRARGFGEYLSLFPGDPEGVAREFFALEEAQKSRRATRPGRSPGRRMIGPYRVLRELGRGGQGVVYEAEDVRLGRKVALKLLTSVAVPDEEALARFYREAEMASRLDHPGICTVFEAGTDDGLSYIAMQCVPGQSLARCLDHRARGGVSDSTRVDLDEVEVPVIDAAGSDPSPTPRSRSSWNDVAHVVRLIEKTARAVQAAHDAGVVHRDIKPGNIMITPSGDPVILDFGVARDLATEEGELTQSGEIFGTPAYMAPEQLQPGKSSDARADVWALGVILYESLALVRPFHGSCRQALYRAILEEDPQDVRRLNPAVPTDLKVVVERALEKEPECRYASAGEFADDLARVLRLEPVAARPVTSLGRLVRAARRNPAAALSLTLALLVFGAALGTGVSLFGMAELERSKKEVAQRDQRRAEDQRNAALEEADRLKRNLEALRAKNGIILLPAVGVQDSLGLKGVPGEVLQIDLRSSPWSGGVVSTGAEILEVAPEGAGRPTPPRALEGHPKAFTTSFQGSVFHLSRGHVESPDQIATSLMQSVALQQVGRWEEAADKLREPLHFFEKRGSVPAVAAIHQNRGLILGIMGHNEGALSDLGRAEEAYQELGDQESRAIVLCNRGALLQREGRFQESLEALREGHRLGRDAAWEHPAREWVARAEGLASVERRLEEVDGRSDREIPVRESLLFARMAAFKKNFPLAVRCYTRYVDAEAGATDPFLLFEAATVALWCSRSEDGSAAPALSKALGSKEPGTPAPAVTSEDGASRSVKALAWIQRGLRGLECPAKLPHASRLRQFAILGTLEKALDLGGEASRGHEASVAWDAVRERVGSLAQLPSPKRP